jgi:peptidoglycan hydrolase-like protein with peptidoglycan-binding domain
MKANSARQLTRDSDLRRSGQPSLEDALAGRGQIRRGQQNSDGVRQVQQALQARGYPVEVTGNFDATTDFALHSFQRAVGAKVDGVVGRETARLLGPGGPSFEEARVGRGLIRHGQVESEGVREVQRRLVWAGHPVAESGNFDGPTEQAVRAFQRGAGARRVDGIVGPETSRLLAAVRAPTAPEAPIPVEAAAEVEPVPGDGYQEEVPPTAEEVNPLLAGATEREKFDFYAAMVRRAGGEVTPRGQPTVLGIRGLAPDGRRNTSGVSSTPQYDDTLVVLTANGRVHEFRGATHPGQTSSTLAPDVNGDRRGDVGMIRPGNYQAVPNGNAAKYGQPTFHIRTLGDSGRLPGWRDTNQDGVYSDEEKAASVRRGDTLGEVIFHPGADGAPVSIGCQTLPPAEYERFLRALGGGSARFNFTLVDANQVPAEPERVAAGGRPLIIRG